MQPADNLHVWRVLDGALLGSFFQRAQANWAPQWTDDETRMSRLVSNEVQVYSSDDLAKGGACVDHLRERASVILTSAGPARQVPAPLAPPGRIHFQVLRSAFAWRA